MMSNIIINLLIVNFCVVFIWDYTGFVFEFTNSIVKYITGGKINKVQLNKPFGCSLCMIVWLSFFYLLFTGLPFLYVVFISLINGFLSKYVFFILQTIDMLIERLIIILQKIINWKK